MNYTEKLNALKASASAELERLIRKYGVENKCETDESTYSVFIGTDSPYYFVVIDRVFCGRDYPLELVLDPTAHANETDFIVYPKSGYDYDHYVECTDDICMLVDYLKKKYND